MNEPNSSVSIRWRRWIWLLLVIPVLVVAYVQLTLHWAYSEGDRAGVLQKLSTKGWICKTHEGELGMYLVGGMAPQVFYFTVRDDKVAEELNSHLGERVRLHYREHRGIPSSCFGDTNYFVDAVSRAAE